MGICKFADTRTQSKIAVALAVQGQGEHEGRTGKRIDMNRKVIGKCCYLKEMRGIT